MNTEIVLGYEIGTGRRIVIPLRHTAVFGRTQESGKTTTLEGLITRSGLRGVAYITKRGESSFHVMRTISPYFRERTDWQFVAAILEATLSEKLKFQRSWIMKLCEARHAKNETWPAPRTLADVQRNVEIALEKARGMNEGVYYELREYLRMVIPQIDRLPYSTELSLAPGVNVMNLADYDFPLQALVVRSAIEWIRLHEKNTISIIPECPKFAPKQRGSPVKLAAEELIREGGALRNFIWLDSQDVAGVADVLLRQIGVWIFGVQGAKHEISRTLDHIPEGLVGRRPKPQDIATLSKGQFFVCHGNEMAKVYVQPAWMTAAHAEAIARGEEEVESARDILIDYDREHPREKEKTAANAKDSHDRVPARAADRDSAVQAPTEDDAMWQEKYNELKGRYDQLEAAHDALAERLRKLEGSAPGALVPTRGPAAGVAAAVKPGLGAAAASNSHDRNDLDEIYQYIKSRAVADPVLLRVLTQRPELEIDVVRQQIDLSESTLRGKLALLIHEGFFNEPHTASAAYTELTTRRKFKTAKPNVYKECDALANMGFLIGSGEGYQTVPGMKIHIIEGKS